MHRRLIGGLLAIIAAASLSSVSASAAARPNNPAELIQSVSAEVGAIAAKRSGGEREAAMREILRQDFDLLSVARAALGPHWSEASPEQQTRILAAFETSQAQSYADRLGSFSSFSVASVTPKAPGVWRVDSKLNLKGGQPIKVEWEVRQSSQDLRIADVKVEGVSLFLAERAAFQSYIQRHGGKVEPLVQVLEARAAR